jgi:hypothetical protein
MRAVLQALIVAGCLLAGLMTSALAQNTDTYFYTPGGSGVNGAVGMCLNSSNKAVPCSAANVAPSPVVDAPYPYTPLTPNQKNVSIASSTTLTIPTGATYAVVTAVGGQAYYSFDGTAPTSSSYDGTLTTAGQAVALSGPAVLAAFKIIGASMSVAYFK